jgi:nucleoside 2-deoxyribosyltransferase
MERQLRKTSFLISPVRGYQLGAWEDVVKSLAADGFDVHWPLRDTDQSDNTGFDICSNNLKAISNADVVHVIWDGKSEGCLFDLGVAFALRKRIVVITLPETTEFKSFQNMIRIWETVGPPPL